MKVVYCSTEGLKIGGLGSGPLLKMGSFRTGPHVKKGGFGAKKNKKKKKKKKTYIFVKDHEKDDRFLAAQVEKVVFRRC